MGGRLRETVSNTYEKFSFGLGYIAGNHNKTFLDTCAIIGYISIGGFLSQFMQERGAVSVLKKFVEEKGNLFTIKQVRDEVLCRGSKTYCSKNGKVGEYTWGVEKEFFKLLEEKNLLLPGYYNGSDYLGCIEDVLASPYVIDLDGADVPIFAEAYYNSRFGEDAALITNDTSMMKAWWKLKKDGYLDRPGNGKFSIYSRIKMNGECLEVNEHTISYFTDRRIKRKELFRN